MDTGSTSPIANGTDPLTAGINAVEPMHKTMRYADVGPQDHDYHKDHYPF